MCQIGVLFLSYTYMCQIGVLFLSYTYMCVRVCVFKGTDVLCFLVNLAMLRHFGYLFWKLN